jgi:hypothetical protein
MSESLSSESQLVRLRLRLFLVRLRIALRTVLMAETFTTWGSVTLWSVIAGAIATCVSAGLGLEVDKSLLVGLAALASAQFVVLACAGFRNTESLRPQRIEL